MRARVCVCVRACCGARGWLRYSGELGPSTIVGSAAFNLLMILAICVVCIPGGGSRQIKDLTVYACTAFASIFAYMWRRPAPPTPRVELLPLNGASLVVVVGVGG